MLLDTQNLFSDEQKITSGTIVSENVIKFGKGDISYLPFIAQVVNDFSNITSLTLKVETCENQDFLNPETLVQSSLQLSELKAGNVFPISHFPKGNKGYMRLSYVVASENDVVETTGKITAGAALSALG